MKATIALLIAVIATIALADGSYDFRTPTPRDRAVAQLAGDWMFHDDWHAPIPTNAYSARRQKSIQESRNTLRTKYTTLPIDVRSGTNSFALFTYNVKDRTLAERPPVPDPWPVPRTIVVEVHSPKRDPQLKVSWSAGSWYFLGIHEEAKGPVVVSIDNRMFVD